MAELEPKRQEKARTGVLSSSECCPLELELVQPVAGAQQWAHSTCAAPLLLSWEAAPVERRGQGAQGQVLAPVQQQE